jgi:hypothetical protein
MQARRSIHPVAALSFLFCEVASWIVGDVVVSAAIFLLNLLIIATIGRCTRFKLLRLIFITALYGAVLLSLIHGLAAELFTFVSCGFRDPHGTCALRNATDYLSVREIANYLFRVLIPLSAASAAYSVIELDKLSSQVIKWGVPLTVWQVICQTFVQVAELGKGAKEALIRHQLTGRRIQTVADRFLLLADLVTSIFYRGLLHSQESYVAVSSRLQVRGRPTSVIPMSFGFADFVTCIVGLGIFLVTLGARIIHD